MRWRASESCAQCDKQKEEGCQSLLAIDDLVVALGSCRGDQDRPDEILRICRCTFKLFVDIQEELCDLLLAPDVFALVVRDYVEALAKGLSIVYL